MKKFIAIALIVLSATTSFAKDTQRTEEEKTLYAVGLVVARSLAIFNFTPAELETVKQGISDAVSGRKPELELAAYNEKVQEMAKARRKALGEKQALRDKDFLENAAKESGAVKTASGLIYVSLREGSGDTPVQTNTVKVNYRGTLANGTEFDSSYKRGKSLEFNLGSVIKCWSEGLQKMKVGGKAKLVCPSSIAYGEAGAGDLILPGATLMFEVELLEIGK
jgi:FKBP-type peptidyl-prolyl cis-trans isomerase FkpA